MEAGDRGLEEMGDDGRQIIFHSCDMNGWGDRTLSGTNFMGSCWRLVALVRVQIDTLLALGLFRVPIPRTSFFT